MAAASDKARFYLEQYVPELQEYAQKEIFRRDEINSIAAKRSDFEHILNARGSTPADYARYATYEMNLSALVKKRCKRLGVKNDRAFSGQRTIYFILDRGTKKFPGDLSLWMQYIHFCQKQKANQKLVKVLTQALRLMPREWGLWVLAAKWYAEQQGDMQTARSYLQRGLRFCKDKRELWREYLRLEMVYLAKLAARRKILGLDEAKIEGTVNEDDENMIALPTITANEIDHQARKEANEVDAEILEKLVKAPVFTGAIPVAIVDAAMKQFKGNTKVAETFFEVVKTFEQVPSTTKILRHILHHLQSTAPDSPEAVCCEATLYTFAIDVLSAEYPMALGRTLSTINKALPKLKDTERVVLAEKAVLLLMRPLGALEELDENVSKVIEASMNRYLRTLATPQSSIQSTNLASVQRLVQALVDKGRLTGSDMRSLLQQTAAET